MKKKLQAILPAAVPSQLFVLTCIFLLIVGALSWTATDKIARDADAGMRVLTQPTPKSATMVQARR